MWVIGGSSPSATAKVHWSTDGITWTEAGTDALPTTRRYHASVAFDPGNGEKMWVIGGEVPGPAATRKVHWSTDGITWTEAGTDALPNATQWLSAIVSESKMWAIGGFLSSATDKVYWSTDGVTWNEDVSYFIPVPIYVHSSLAYNSKMWVIGGATGGAVSRKVFSFTLLDLTGLGVNDSVYLENNVGTLTEVLKRIIKWADGTNSEYAVQVLLDGVLTEILSMVGDHIKLNGFAQLKEIADPSGSPTSGFGRLWLSSDTSKLRFQDDSGNKWNIDMTAV
jgi:hypothetical protein